MVTASEPPPTPDERELPAHGVLRLPPGRGGTREATSPHRTIIDHVEQVRGRMAQIWPVVRGHLGRAQQAQSRIYNRGAQLRTINLGDQVVVLVPTSECKFLAKWQGPYEVGDRVSDVNYRVRQPGKTRLSRYITSTF